MDAWIVEPSNFFRRILMKQLSSLGFQVHEYGSAVSFLQEIHNQNADLICVSLVSLDLSGTVVIRQIKTDPALASAVTLLLTSSSDNEVGVEAEKAGADGIFYKSDLGKFRSFLVERFPPGLIRQEGRQRLLYVEDSPLVQKIVLRYLEGENIEVVVCPTAEEAWEQYSEISFDIVLSDLNLGAGMTGLELLQKIRQSPGGGPPVLMVTAAEEREEKQNLYAAGAQDLVLKPVVKEELLARVKAWLRIQRLENRLAQVSADNSCSD